jgi:hypothetical protein
VVPSDVEGGHVVLKVAPGVLNGGTRCLNLVAADRALVLNLPAKSWFAWPQRRGFLAV